jgi:hypothetical protein
MPQRVVLRVVLGLLPLWILLYLFIAVPGSIDPITANPPALAGLPAGILVVGAALVVMAIGVEVLRRTSSTVSMLLALAFLTLPSAVVMVMAPSLILMIQSSPILWMS